MKKRTVLVVEDSAETRASMAALLEGEGYEVLLAEHGGEGILMAHQLRPDVILMDVSMPVVDGLDAAESLKLNPLTRAIPIVAITAESLQPQLERIRRVCDAMLLKPCPPLDILGEVERHVRAAS
jgi:two-component system, cell cycle response regulator DivK